MVLKSLKRPLCYALLYLVISLGTEASLITFFKFKIPTAEHANDGLKLGAVLFTVVPVTAALLTGFRGRKHISILIILTAVLTQLFASTIITLTGWWTGFTEPIITRFSAGLIAALITTHIINRNPRVRIEADNNAIQSDKQ